MRRPTPDALKPKATVGPSSPHPPPSLNLQCPHPQQALVSTPTPTTGTTKGRRVHKTRACLPLDAPIDTNTTAGWSRVEEGGCGGGPTSASEMDDFSFPTIAADPDSLCQLPFPHFAASPLWFLSSVADPKAARQRRSFSSAEDAYTQREEFASPAGRRLSSPSLSADGNSRRFLENEEKMDMLWEDFNEELARLSHHHHRRQASKDSGAGRDAAAFPGAGVGSKSRKWCRGAKAELRGSPALAMTKSNDLTPHRSPSVMVMLKLLKRLFLVQNPRSSRKTRHCDE